MVIPDSAYSNRRPSLFNEYGAAASPEARAAQDHFGRLFKEWFDMYKNAYRVHELEQLAIYELSGQCSQERLGQALTLRKLELFNEQQEAEKVSRESGN